MPIDQKLLGKAIRHVRELRGLSQVALAQEAGLRGNSVALIERGERGISIDTLNTIAEALEIPSACLTMLGMSRIRGLGDSARLVKSFQKLIVASLAAESKLEARHADKKGPRMRSSQRKRKPGSQKTKLAKAKAYQA